MNIHVLFGIISGVNILACSVSSILSDSWAVKDPPCNNRLYTTLKNERTDIYEKLGRASLFANSSIRSSRKLVKFITSDYKLYKLENTKTLKYTIYCRRLYISGIILIILTIL